MYKTVTSGHGGDTKLEVDDALYGDEESMDDHGSNDKLLLLENDRRDTTVVEQIHLLHIRTWVSATVADYETCLEICKKGVLFKTYL